MSDTLMLDIAIAVSKARARKLHGIIPVHASKTALLQLCRAWNVPCPLDAPPEYTDFAESEWDGEVVFSAMGAVFVYERSMPDDAWRVDV